MSSAAGLQRRTGDDRGSGPDRRLHAETTTVATIAQRGIQSQLLQTRDYLRQKEAVAPGAVRNTIQDLQVQPVRVMSEPDHQHQFRQQIWRCRIRQEDPGGGLPAILVVRQPPHF